MKEESCTKKDIWILITGSAVLDEEDFRLVGVALLSSTFPEVFFLFVVS